MTLSDEQMNEATDASNNSLAIAAGIVIGIVVSGIGYSIKYNWDKLKESKSSK